jgi:hypothetical protein
MTVRIRSLARLGPVMVPLSSGGMLRLAPGQLVADLPDFELTDNAGVDKLVALRLVDLWVAEEESVEPTGSDAERAGSGDRYPASEQADKTEADKTEAAGSEPETAPGETVKPARRSSSRQR